MVEQEVLSWFSRVGVLGNCAFHQLVDIEHFIDYFWASVY